MIFNKIQSIPYDISLNKPFQNAKTSIIERSGLIINLFIDDDCGCGESAPLSPYSDESITEISWNLEELKAALKSSSNYMKDDLFDLFELYTRDVPSLHFALDISLYDIIAKKEKISLAQYLNPKNLNEVKFSSIYNGLINKSFKKIKIKFGVKSIEEDVDLLHDLSKEYGDDVQFRIDANQAYSIDDFLYLLNKINTLNIEYIEEPLAALNIENLNIIKNETDIPIAIDESIFKNNYKEFSENQLVDYAIIKPSLYGGVKSIIKLVDYFKKYNIEVVFSSSLNTKIGNIANIHLASALELPNHHGLNNYTFFNLGQTQLPYGPNDSAMKINKLIGLGVCSNG